MLPENYRHMVATENVLLSHTILVGFISMFKCSLNAELIETQNFSHITTMEETI